MDDREWLASQFETLRPRLQSIAYSILGSVGDAEDAVQECYLRALRHFGSWRGDLAKGDTIKPWLFAILRNVCYSELNRRRRQETPTDLADDKYSAEPLVWQEPQSLPEADIADRQESAAVRHLVTTLPEVYREAIVLREYDDMSYREISEVTGVPIGTVMSRLSRARRRVATALGQTQEAS